MGLREQAQADVRTFLTDQDHFGWPITVRNPAGATAVLSGYTADVAATIDPDTGLSVVGREITCSIPKATIEEAGLGTPVAINETDQAPWRVTFADPTGTVYDFKIREIRPDNVVDCLVFILEFWNDNDLQA